MTTQDILERVRKLLELGKSDNQNEAELAINKAHQLMRDHAISEAQLFKGTEKDINVNHSDVILPDNGKPWTRGLFMNIAEAFHCQPIFLQRYQEGKKNASFYVRFFGTSGDIATVHLMWNFALDCKDRIMETERKEIRANRRIIHDSFRVYMNSFQSGIIDGMSTTLEGIKEQKRKDKHTQTPDTEKTYSLVLIKTEEKVSKAFKKMYPKTSRTSVSGSANSNAGYSNGNTAGSQVGFNKRASGGSRGLIS